MLCKVIHITIIYYSINTKGWQQFHLIINIEITWKILLLILHLTGIAKEDKALSHLIRKELKL